MATSCVRSPKKRRFLLPCAFGLAGALAAQQVPTVRDVRGTVQGGAGDTVRVTLWHNDLHLASVDAAGETLAAADGTFTLRAVPWFEKQQWGSHSFVLLARSKQRVGVLTLRGDAVDAGNLRVDLGPATTVRGVVRSDNGRPAAGVEVWARILGDPGRRDTVWLAAPLPLWTAVADAEGRFALEGLPPAAPLHLMTRSLDHARTPIRLDDAGKPVDVVLADGGKVRGRVLLPDGKPAIRVRVRATGEGAEYGDAMTGDDGTFCLGGLAGGVYKVWAEAPELTVIAVLGLAVAGGQTVDGQVVQLVHGGFIVGRIVDKATGLPITPGPQTDVAMYGPARGNGGACEVAPVLPDGTFRIRAPAGRNRIYLRSAEGWSERGEYVDVVEGQETKVEWQLQRTLPAPRRGDGR